MQPHRLVFGNLRKGRGPSNQALLILKTKRTTCTSLAVNVLIVTFLLNQIMCV